MNLDHLVPHIEEVRAASANTEGARSLYESASIALAEAQDREQKARRAFRDAVQALTEGDSA